MIEYIQRGDFYAGYDIAYEIYSFDFFACIHKKHSLHVWSIFVFLSVGFFIGKSCTFQKNRLTKRVVCDLIGA